jgi:hypothetical protein
MALRTAAAEKYLRPAQRATILDEWKGVLSRRLMRAVSIMLQAQ